MLKRKKGTLSMLCVFCIVFSMLIGQTIAFAANYEGLTEGEAIELRSNATEDQKLTIDDNKRGSSDDSEESYEKAHEAVIEEKAIPDEKEARGLFENEPKGTHINEGETDSSNSTEEIVDVDNPVAYNTEPIKGKVSQNGVSVKVTAPIKSFPEGTTLIIDELSPEKNKIGFDIAFKDAKGNEIQPADGMNVKIQFSIDTDSSIHPKNKKNTQFSAYCENDDGTVEILKSVPVTDDPASIEILANHFSKYGVLTEKKEKDLPRAINEKGSDKTDRFHASINTNNDTYESGTTAIVSVKYSLEPGTISPGDYVIMTIPESIANSVNFSLNSQHFSGYEYLGGGQYRLIFGEGVQTGLSGSFSAFVTTNAETTTTDIITVGDASAEITVVPGGAPSGPGVYTDAIMKDASDNPGISYGGYDYSDGYGDHAAQIGLADLTNGGTFKYRLYVNNKEANLSNVTLIDQLPDGMTLNTEKGFQVVDASTGAPIDPSLYSIRVSGQTITFSYPGEFNNRIQINYWVDIPVGSNQSKYTNTATITYTQDGNVYQEHRNYVLQGTANSASNGEKSVDKTEISTDPSDQFVTYTIKFWNSNGFDVGEINLTDELDPHVRFVSASDNEYFSIIQDSADPQKIHISNTSAISESLTVYVRFIVDMTNVPEGYTVENTVGGNTTKTTKDISLKLNSTKTVDGKEPGDLRFDFELCDADGNVVQTKKNDSAGNIVFDSLDYSANDIGTHTYIIREKDNPDSSYTQDTSVYTVTVNVSRTETGALKTDIVYEKDGNLIEPESIIFNNTSETISVDGTKTWIGDNEIVRPESIVVKLLADGEIIDSQTVTASTDWTYSFDGLQKYKDGNEIQYSVIEDAIDGYQSEINGFDITNTYSPASTSVQFSGIKTLNGKDLQDGEFSFMLTGSDGTNETVTNDGDGKITFSEISYDNTGTYTYEVKENASDEDGVTIDDNVYNITVEVTDDGSGQLKATVTGADINELNFTNTYAPEVTEVSGTKTWDDNDDQDGTRPESITIRLYADGVETDSKTVTAEDDWSWSFTDLPKFSDGSEISYSVTEDAVSDYSAEYDGYDVKNTHTPGKTSVSVTKSWNDDNDQDGIRPLSITVKLLADGTDTGQTKELNAGNNWTDSFTDLDEYKSGQKIVYTIEEVNVSGYTSAITGDADSGYTITNNHTPEATDISGSKTWEDNDDQDGARPESITINLLADGEIKESKTITASDNWSWNFTDLPKFSNGSEISYSITEDAVTDYSTEYNGYDVTNTHTPGKTSISVTKAWDDNNDQDGIRPQSIIVKLLADGNDTGKTKELNAGNNWTDSFTDLDEHSNGRKIAYTIEEATVEGYTSEITGDSQIGFIITNTHTPEVTEVSGSKTWKDNDDQDGARPESITINLLVDGHIKESKIVTAADNWSWSFTDLPKFSNGSEISYSITEDAVTDYSTEYDGFDVTNTHAPGKTSISVTKSWNDNNDQDGIRPNWVTVKLLADGKETGSFVKLKESNGWTASFTDLEKYENGKLIDYTVSETEVYGYTAKISGNADEGYVITNTHNPERPKASNTPSKTGRPKTGDETQVVLYLGILAAAGAAILIMTILRRRKDDE